MTSLITASIASIPKRKKGLYKVVQRILPQVDQMFVYLNNYIAIPDFLKTNKIVVNTSQNHGNLKDIGKFFCVDQIKGYHIVLDDDLIYPLDYVIRLIKKIDSYNWKYCIGVHGILLSQPVNDYYQNRKSYHFCSEMKNDRLVHLLGTGTLAYHTNTIRMYLEDFKKPNMTDIWFGLKAQQKKVGLMCISRPNNWLQNNKHTNQRDSIF